jgi:hypothetical protein
MKTYEVHHIDIADFNSDRMLNEFGSKRPAKFVVVGRVEAESRGKANCEARRLFPAPAGYAVNCEELKAGEQS